MRIPMLILTSLMLAGCATSSTSSVTGCVARIGIVNSLSGVFAEGGRDLQRGYEMARDEINARGDLPGCVVQLDTRDDHSIPAQAKQATQELVREPIIALIGAANTDLTMPVAALADANHLPLIVPTASNDVLTAAFASTVRIAASQPQIVGTQFEFLENLRANGTRAQSVGILYEASESGRGVFVAVQRAAHDHAIALIAAETFAQGATDWRVALERIQRARPDVLYLDTNHLSDPTGLVSQVRDLGFAPSVIFASTLSDSWLTNNPRAENLVTSVQWLATLDWRDESGVTASEWARQFEQRYHAPANFKNIAGYAAVHLVARALKPLGASPSLFANPSSLRPPLLRALYQVRASNTVFGPLRFDDLGQNIHPVFIAQIIAGALTIVYPETYRAHPLVMPPTPHE